MKVQIVSDIHLEDRNGVFDFVVSAQLLILAGDICNVTSPIYASFLETQSTRFDKVFIVAGNHEAYGISLDLMHNKIEEVCASRDNLIYLNQTKYQLDSETIILGCTLWSDIRQSQSYAVQSYLSDMRCIQEWSIDKHNLLHRVHRDWLSKAISSAQKNEKIIVITHHCPSFRGTQAAQYSHNDVGSAFCTNLDYMLHPPVALWVCGHTHFSFNKLVNGSTRFVSNQAGQLNSNI